MDFGRSRTHSSGASGSALGDRPELHPELLTMSAPAPQGLASSLLVLLSLPSCDLTSPSGELGRSNKVFLGRGYHADVGLLKV